MVTEMAFHVNLSSVATEPNKGMHADTKPRGTNMASLPVALYPRSFVPVMPSVEPVEKVKFNFFFAD